MTLKREPSEREKRSRNRIIELINNMCGGSQKRFVEETGINKGSVSQYVHGNNYISPVNAEKVARAFGKEVDWVLGAADQQYYLDKEAQQYTEFLAKNPGHRVLFDASMKVSPDDLDKVAQMLGIFGKKD